MYGQIGQKKLMYIRKLSIPGKQSQELSYIFADGPIEHQNSSVVLFGMFDIKSVSEIYHTIIKETVKHFLDFYHSIPTLESMSSEGMPDSSEFIFEHSIQHTYEKVSDALREFQEQSIRGHNVDLKRINCLLGAFIDDTLFLSVTGTTLYPFLIYPVTNKQNARQYMIMNILEHGGESGHDQGNRLFSNIISGKVSLPSSSVLICNQSFLDYINPQQIKQTISNTPIPAVIPYIERLLSKVNARNDFSVLLFSKDAAANHHYQNNARTTISSVSMEDLNVTEETTRSILTPTMSPYLKKYGGAFIKFCWRMLVAGSRRSIHILRSLTSEEKRRSYKKGLDASKNFFSHCIESSALILRTFWKKLQGLSTILRSPDARTRMQRQISDWVLHIKNLTDHWIVKYKNLTPVSRSLFLLSTLFIFLFCASLLSITLKNSGDQKNSRYQGTLTAIQQKIDSAEASLIYDDKKRAEELLGEAQALFSLIDEKQKSKGQTVALTQKVNDLSAKLSNVIRIDQPEVLARIPEDASAPLPPLQLTGVRDGIIAYSQDLHFIYQPSDHSFPQSGLAEKIPRISCAIPSADTILYFCNESADRLYQLTLPEKTVKTLSIAKAADERIDLARAYNGRIYTLTRSTGTLYRHVKNGDSFSSPTSWLKQSEVSLKNARDFAVDGSVYVLTADGSLITLSSGKVQPREVPQSTRDLLKDASHIATDSDTPLLYLLDAVNKRIVMLDKKTFEAKGQITSSKFNQLRGMVISKNKKEAFLLDGIQLLKVPLERK